MHQGNNKHYILPGAISTHIEFPSHYSTGFNSNDLLQQFMRDNNPHLQSTQFIFSNKNNIQNEFTRNLVPPLPPYKAVFETEILGKQRPTSLAETIKSVKNNDLQIHTTHNPSTINDNPQIILGKQKNKQKPVDRVHPNTVPEKIIVQLPPPHEHSPSVEVTRENLQVYHGRPELHDFFEPSLDSHGKLPTSHYSHTYEVTEGKYEETTQHSVPYQRQKQKYSNQIPSTVYEQEQFSFLPTPYRPGSVNPTISTQETSTSNAIYQKTKPNYYLENRPQNDQLLTQLTVPSRESERINFAPNEVTTNQEYEGPLMPTVNPSSYYYAINQDDITTTNAPETTTKRLRYTSTTAAPVRSKTRNINRRRRPSTTTPKPVTTTYNPPEQDSSIETSKYQHIPNRNKYNKPYRAFTTTETPIPEPEIYTSAQPASTLPLQSYESSAVEETSSEPYESVKHKYRARPTNFQDEFEDNDYLIRPDSYPQQIQEESITEKYETVKYKKPIKEKIKYNPTTYNDFYNKESTKYEDLQYTTPDRPQKSTTTQVPYRQEETSHRQEETFHRQEETSQPEEITEHFDIVKLTENEILESEIKESATTKLPYHETTEVEITTTTEAPTPNTIKTRTKPPNRYETNRPRFSVKEYRQRLNQTSAEPTKIPTETTSSRVRFPVRTRLSTSTPSTSTISGDEQPTKRYTSNRIKPSKVEEPETSTQKSRLRTSSGKYYNRFRSTTTESPTSQNVVQPPKVVIKPNTLLRRPPQLSLRTRIQNKQKLNNSQPDEKEQESIKTEASEHFVTTIAATSTDQAKWVPDSNKFGIEDLFEKTNLTDLEADKEDDSEDDPDESYSQRIAELTSSLSAGQNDAVSTSNIFKTVPNTSRRVPNYFTIATDDPILPIEAFFPQLSHGKDSGKE